MKGITFSSVLNKITTTIDGGWRITFDVSDSESENMTDLAMMRNRRLQIGIVDLNSPENSSGNREKTENG